MITENTHVPGPLSYLILCLCKDMDVCVYKYRYVRILNVLKRAA